MHREENFVQTPKTRLLHLHQVDLVRVDRPQRHRRPLLRRHRCRPRLRTKRQLSPRVDRRNQRSIHMRVQILSAGISAVEIIEKLHNECGSSIRTYFTSLKCILSAIYLHFECNLKVNFL